MRALFREAVEQAQAAGTIAPTRDPEALGRSLTNAFYGLHLTAKTNPPSSVVDDIVDETIRGLTGPDRSPEAV
jgi:TetR/AcrR family transcriptional repressor of nem operon